MYMKKFQIKISKLDENPKRSDLLLLLVECIWGLIFMIGTLIKDVYKFIRLSLSLILGIVLILLFLIISFLSRVLGPFIMVCFGFGLWYLVTGETWLFSPDYIIAFTVFIAVVAFFRNKGA